MGPVTKRNCVRLYGTRIPLQKEIKVTSTVTISVADPGCLSRILDPGSRIPDPGSRIPDPKTVPKERGEKKFVIILFFLVTNFTKLNVMLFLKC
jgi:hypothetical protein